MYRVGMTYRQAFSDLHSYLRFRGERILRAEQDQRILPPWAVEIQPNSADRCNLKCYYCSYQNRPTAELSGEVWSGLMGSLVQMGVRVAWISGGGEPLLYGGTLPGVVFLAQNGISVNLITNATMWQRRGQRDEDRLSALSFCNYVQASMIAATPKTYLATCGSRLHGRILAFPAALKRSIGNRTRRTLLSALFVISERNCHEAIDALKVGYDVGFDFVRFKVVQDWEAQFGTHFSAEVGPKLWGLERAWEAEKADPKHPAVRLHGRLSNLDAVIRSIHEPQRKWPAGVPCAAVHESWIAIVDGDVYRCPPDVGRKELSIGNLNEQTLEEVWFGKKHQRVVEELHARHSFGKCPSHCRFLGRMYGPLGEVDGEEAFVP